MQNMQQMRMQQMEEASVAGESPDRSKQRESSAEPTSGSAGSVPKARELRDPRLAVTSESPSRGGVDTATRVFSVRELEIEPEADTETEEAAGGRTDAEGAQGDGDAGGAGSAGSGAGSGDAGGADGARGAGGRAGSGSGSRAEGESGSGSEPSATDAGGAGRAESGTDSGGEAGAVASGGSEDVKGAEEGAEGSSEGPGDHESGSGASHPSGGPEDGDGRLRAAAARSATSEDETPEPGADAGATDASARNPAAGKAGEDTDAADEDGTAPGAKQKPEADAGTGTKTEAGAGAEGDRSSEPEAGADAKDGAGGGSAAKAAPSGKAAAGAGAGAAAASDAPAGAEPEAGAGTDTGVGAGTGTDAEADPQPEAGARSGAKPGDAPGDAPAARASAKVAPKWASGADADSGDKGDEDGKGGEGDEHSSAGDAPSAEDSPVDQPTAVFKTPRPKPSVDQPTTMLKLGDVPKPKPTPAAEAEAEPTAEPAPAPEVERTSRFVALKPLDEPRQPKAAPPETTAYVPQVGPERTTQQPLPPKPPLDLLAELTNTPPPPPTVLRGLGRRVKIWTPLAILLAVVFAIAQAVRPLPATALELTAKDSYTFEGGKLTLPWPDEGQGAMDVNGIGNMDGFGDQKPVAIGSVAKAMTAYIVLKDHPLKAGAEGPSIPVDSTAEKEGGYDADGESTLNTVKAGDELTEKQALSAIMIPSANNIARLLARWDAGTEAAFIKRMNATAKELGMTNTTYTDASGLKETTVSTAADQVKLGNELVKIQALTDITKLPEWTDPSGQKWRNYNTLVPYNNAIGIKTGSTTAAGGNLLFAATKEAGGETVTVVGAILGQHKSPIIDTVNAVSKNALLAAQGAITSAKILKKGDVVGYVDDKMGGRTPVVVTKDVPAVGWAGLTVKLKFAADDVPHTAKAGTQVGTLTVGDGTSSAVKVPVALESDLTEPGFTDKLTRIG
ncbi:MULTISPECIES: D-alanyl-D-alanine carboxypeptidase [Streptomyces]|uniref:serine-type D-Ala-D-Ala carboxypeptidase n=2 Tax=Streptomyces TaxID=1883 RepID=A0ABV9IK77_9ACTN